MKTLYKIALAKAAYRAAHSARSLVGLSDRCIVERHGVKFDLDLSEGIDFAIYLQGYFEPSTAKAIARNIVPGVTVIDIGANVGAHTLHMAKLVGEDGRVFAFEPTNFAFQKLQRNIDLNPALTRRVSVHQCFLGHGDDGGVPTDIYSSWPLAGGDDLHAKHLGQPKTTKDAVCRSLDSVLAEHGSPIIHLIKLDVDGFECDVLAGAQHTMQRDHPIFVMELSPYVLKERGASLERLLSFFTPLGYRFYDEKTDRMLPNDETQLSNLVADGASKNVIARV